MRNIVKPSYNLGLLLLFFFIVIYFFLDFKIKQIINNYYIKLTNNKKDTIVFYNRIPKTGSTTLTNAIAYDLCEINNFYSIHINMTKNRYMINLIDQGILIRNISEWKNVKPVFYHGHVAFFDFTKFGYKNPIYINVVREPFERLLSHYYFLRYGDDFRVNLKRRKFGSNETFDSCIQNKGKDCDSKQLWLQIPYFCGTSSFCSEVGNKKALEMAKWNLLNNYLVVGLTERMSDMIQILEHLLPNFFRGALKHYQSLTEKRAHMRNTVKKILPSAETLEIIKNDKIYLMEKDLYDFAAVQFDYLFQKCFTQTKKIVLKNQFHFEKIRPII